MCPEKYETEAAKKGQIRPYGLEQNGNDTSWSEKFSLDVIQSTGMATCKLPNDRNYMVIEVIFII